MGASIPRHPASAAPAEIIADLVEHATVIAEGVLSPDLLRASTRRSTRSSRG